MAIEPFRQKRLVSLWTDLFSHTTETSSAQVWSRVLKFTRLYWERRPILLERDGGNVSSTAELANILGGKFDS